MSMDSVADDLVRTLERTMVALETIAILLNEQREFQFRKCTHCHSPLMVGTKCDACEREIDQ